MPTNALRTLTDICREMVRDAMTLYPDEPATLLSLQKGRWIRRVIESLKELCGELADQLDTEDERDLSRYLVSAFFLRLIRAERATAKKAKRDQLLLPGFEHLPLEIDVFAKSVPLGAATTRQVREFVRLLIREHRQRAKSDPVLNQARALLALMEKHAARNERITVDEVLRRTAPNSDTAGD